MSGRVAQDFVKHNGRGRSRERRHAGRHFIQCHSEGEQIRSGVEGDGMTAMEERILMYRNPPSATVPA